jgi:hypothetical protein
MKNSILTNPTEDQKRNEIILNQIAADLAERSTDLTIKEEMLNDLLLKYTLLTLQFQFSDN